MNPETSLMHQIMLAASRGASRLFRQNVGMAWAGKAKRYEKTDTVTVQPGDVIIRAARPFHAGIEGMSDLGGWQTVTVTPDMVGRRLAVYVAMEVKTDTGRVSQEQRDFITAVTDAGGIAGVVRSPADAARLLGG